MAALRYLLLLMALFGVGVAARAETPDVEGIETRLKQRGERVQQISEQLDAGDVSDATLDSQLDGLVGYQGDNQDDAQASKAALDDQTKRLGDLGPPPAEGQPPESAEIARLRKSLTDEVTCNPSARFGLRSLLSYVTLRLRNAGDPQAGLPCRADLSESGPCCDPSACEYA